MAPRFGIALPDLLRANGLSGKIKLAVGSTVLVPAGKGADDLESMGTEPRLPQIVEPEPPANAKVAAASAARPGKPDKAAKGKTADTRVAAKDTKKGGAKLAAADTAKAPAKVAKTAASDKARSAPTRRKPLPRSLRRRLRGPRSPNPAPAAGADSANQVAVHRVRR